MKILIWNICSFLLLISFDLDAQNAASADKAIKVPKTDDFELTGGGTSKEWAQTSWISISRRGEDGKKYKTDAKLLYSDTGIYTLFRCEDDSIVSTLDKDFADLWTEDVVEIFFWPDQSLPVYFEYELSPRNYELPILVPNREGYFLGWRPWKYRGERLTRHKTSISEQPGDATWMAEFFIPYALMTPLTDGAPKSGSEWRVNMYRLDYDDGQSRWAWQPVRTNFHDYESYGTMIFE